MYRQRGRSIRPFSQSARITCRGCSQPLQRAVTDFGADHAFGVVVDKLKEHYGITLAISTIGHITEQHAQHLYHQHQRERIETYPDTAGCEHLIVEMDGSMVPIVEIDEHAKDRRKGKRQGWKEVRLCLAHALGKLTPYFGAEFKTGVDQAGQVLFDCAVHAGFGHQSYVHAVGDGAPWIAEQVEKQLGAQGHYLIDFYHTCQYLGTAASSCAQVHERATWFEQQKSALKRSQVQKVINALIPHLEMDNKDHHLMPVRRAYRYLQNRIQQLDYAKAQALGLPLGSGEIESAHRYVIQERLKIAGAWWKASNLRNMLALRVTRANGLWEQYWQHLEHMNELNATL